jgi:hypothetical protein
MTFSIITLSIKGLYVTLSICDIQHNNAMSIGWLSLCWVSHFIYDYGECHYAECHYDECRGALFTSILIFVSYHLRVLVTVNHSKPCLIGLRYEGILLVWLVNIRLGWKWQTLWLKNCLKKFDYSNPSFSNVLEINRLG